MKRSSIKPGTKPMKRSSFRKPTAEVIATKLKARPSLKPKKSQPKRKSVSQLKKLADQAWSKYVRLRDSNDEGIGECISCGVSKHWKELQCGHFVSRRVNSLRYDEENTNSQCIGCNMFNHGNLYAYAKNLDLKYGDGTADKLHAQRFDTHKLTRDELEQIIHDAKESTQYMLTNA